MIEFILGRYPFWIVIALMMTGLYIVFARENLIKKIVGLNIFQTSVFILYITVGKVAGGTAPIFPAHGDKKHGDEGGHDARQGHGDDGAGEAAHGGDVAHASEAHADAAHHAADAADMLYSNPLPHVLILTAIVVGVATTAVGLALAVRIQEAYGTLEDSQLQSIEAGGTGGSDPQAGRS